MESLVGFPLIPKYVTLNDSEWLFDVFCQVQVQDLLIYLYRQRHGENKAIKYSKMKVTCMHAGSLYKAII